MKSISGCPGDVGDGDGDVENEISKKASMQSAIIASSCDLPHRKVVYINGLHHVSVCENTAHVRLEDASRPSEGK